MSSTTRPNRLPKDDCFFTPAWVTKAIAPYIGMHIARVSTPGTFKRDLVALEPAAGRGYIIRDLMAYGPADHGDELPIVRFDAVELRPEEAPGLLQLGAGNVHSADFLDWAQRGLDEYDLIITNPPFVLAQEFIQTTIDRMRPSSVAAFLLRLAFLGADCRQDLLKKTTPDVHVLSRRPSFDEPIPKKCDPSHTGRHAFPERKPEGDDRIRCTFCNVIKPGTDSDVYAWFIWSRGSSGTVRGEGTWSLL
jgi:hypothetical protein